ncbi:MAG: DUF983 domain-containing protein [Acidimicrobiales bacterium]|nr:DUF983 domain-containing protein [Acidimicrobiales bacterium]
MKKNHAVAPALMVWRGALGRCPRCGGRKLFRSWFKMKQRCPKCGYKIARDEGFWLGGYTMNIVVGEGLLGLYMLVFAAWVIENPGETIKPWLYAAIVIAVVPPILFFKLSRTLWMAIDLMIHPLEPWEEADANLAKESATPAR